MGAASGWGSHHAVGVDRGRARARVPRATGTGAGRRRRGHGGADGRGAFARARNHGGPTAGRDIDLVSCHLKSKLLTFPDGQFQPDDEGQRTRFAGYALGRRTSAVTVRDYANGLRDGHGRERAR